MSTEIDFFELNKDNDNFQNTKNVHNPPHPKSTTTSTSTSITSITSTSTTPQSKSKSKDDLVLEDNLIVNSFDNMGLKENLLRGIYGYGFENPSLIQSKAIPQILKKRDVIVQSQSGTGKTGTFVISTLQSVDATVNGCQGMIIGHTKELACQIYEICTNMAQYLGIKIVLCIGGEPIKKTIDELKSGPIVVVGTPGRILSLLKQRYLLLNKLKMFIIDEADEILSEHFEDQIKNIFRFVHSDAQVCIFSATIPDRVFEITDHFMTDPHKILIDREELTLEGITQFYIDIGKEDYKFSTLCDIFNSVLINQSIIYVNSISRANNLEYKLKKEGYPISLIHSGMNLTQRRKVMSDFKSGSSRILISTDLLSRGIDIQQISVVINYDLPNLNNKEAYLHRIGRSGRFGRKGVAINFVTNFDKKKFYTIQNYYNIKIQEMPSNIQPFLN